MTSADVNALCYVTGVGRGQTNREPLSLDPMPDLSAVQCNVVDIGPVGDVGTYVTLQDTQCKNSTFCLLSLDLISSQALPNTAGTYYVASQDDLYAPRHLVTYYHCTCDVLGCLHVQAVMAALADARVALRTAPWLLRIAPPHAAPVSPLLSGMSWHTGDEDRLVGFALRVGENQGTLAFSMWKGINTSWRQLAVKVHALSGVCRSCGRECVEGRLLSSLVSSASPLWNASILSSKDLRTRINDQTLYVDGAFGHGLSYNIVRRSLGSPGNRYLFNTYINDDLIDSFTENVYFDGVVTSERCDTQPCVHAPWHAFYENSTSSTLSKLRKRFLLK